MDRADLSHPFKVTTGGGVGLLFRHARDEIGVVADYLPLAVFLAVNARRAQRDDTLGGLSGVKRPGKQNTRTLQDGCCLSAAIEKSGNLRALAPTQEGRESYQSPEAYGTQRYLDPARSAVCALENARAAEP